MYLLKCRGEYQDAERGIVTRQWAQVDDSGRVETFATRAEAEAAVTTTSEYDGVAPWNILSHGQLAGHRPTPVPVSDDRAKWPMWARSSGN